MAQQSSDNYPFPPLIELLSIDSTNNYALSLLKPSDLTSRQVFMGHGTAVFAHEQYAGKGQRGRVWQSQKGENLHLSVIIDPGPAGLQQQFLFLAQVAVVVRGFLDHYAQSDLTIKWPNDIYFQDRKAGGILIENVISGSDWKWAVVGIGLNINQVAFKELEGRPPVSLRQITGKPFSSLELARQLQQALLRQLHPCVDRLDAAAIMQAYNHHLFKKNETVRFEQDGSRFEACVREVLPGGQLLVHTDVPRALDFGSVTWVL